MLKTSPIPTSAPSSTSSTTSPKTLRYGAHANTSFLRSHSRERPSPRYFPPHSTDSTSSPNSSMSRAPHVSDSEVTNIPQNGPSQEASLLQDHHQPAHPPPPPEPAPMTATSSAIPTPAKTELAAPQVHGQLARGQAAGHTSSNKRRGSVSPPIEASTDEVQADNKGTSAATTTAAITKRSRPEEEPPVVLPKDYEFCSVEAIVECIVYMIEELIATNDAIRVPGALTRFHSRTPPGISVKDYLRRIAHHATLTPSLLLVMVYFIDRLCALYPDFTINTLTVHRFLITAATVAAKGLSDQFWNNTTYARVGGVKIAELKVLELEFLYRVDWKIIPNPDVLDAYYKGLVARTPGYELEDQTEDEEIYASD